MAGFNPSSALTYKPKWALLIDNEEFEIVKKALGHSSYATAGERTAYLKLYNRLSHIVPPVPDSEPVDNLMMGSAFDLESITPDNYDDAVDD